MSFWQFISQHYFLSSLSLVLQSFDWRSAQPLSTQITSRGAGIPTRSSSMIPRAPSLFQIEEGVVACSSAPMRVASGELVGLRLIIQPSPRQRPPAVLRRSAVRAPATTSASSKYQEKMFVGLDFLKCCFWCHKKLGADMDVFVYKGERAFCSAECRSRHIAKEERQEMEILVRKRRDEFHSRHAAPAKTGGSNRRNLRLQIAA